MELRWNPNITLRQLWHFVAAADAGSMSEAARRLHMAPSAISMSVAELERIVGVQLCVKRKSKGVTLTSAGQTAFIQARQILDMASEMSYIRHDEAPAIRGPLSVGCYTAIAPKVIPMMFEVFAQRCPLVEVSFVEGYHQELQRGVLEGTLDLAVLYDLDIDPELESAVLQRVQPHVLLSEENPLGEKDVVMVSDLADEEILLYDAEPLYRHALGIFRENGIAPSVRHRTRSYATARSLIGRNLGVCVIYDNPTLNRSYEGRTVITKPLAGEREFDVGISIVRSRSVRLHQRAAAWIEVSREVFGPDADVEDLPE